ncbi:MAG: type II secretion system F family protein [Nanoarchaeota archaeon]
MAIDLLFALSRQFPQLKHEIQAAHLKDTPQRFILRIVILSVYLSIGLTVLFLLLALRFRLPIYLVPPFFIVIFFVAFWFFFQTPRVIIQKRRREIEREVLFAGNYILTKTESGVPLFNAMIDASKAEGVASKYFKEIVGEINTGLPIERALEKARDATASDKFKLILSELVTSLKTGADISQSLRAVLKQINTEQIIEIKEYARKLNAVIMIYMVLAVALPSLGMTMFIVIASFFAFELSPPFIILILVLLTFIQFMFLSFFKAIRPVVNV